MFSQLQLQKYYRVFLVCVQDAFNYRSELITRAFRYALNIILISYVWLAAAAESHSTINANQIISYYFFTAMLYSLSNFHTDYVEEDIRLGYISKFLVKPIAPFWYYCIYQGSTALLETILKVAIMFPLMWLLGLNLALSWMNLILFFLSLPLIFFCMFSLYFAISGTAFWFQAVDSIRMSIMFCFRFLSGIFVPLFFLPAWFLQVSQWLPFASVAYFPVQLLQGNLSSQQVAIFFLNLGSWATVFFFLQTIVWKKATHSYESTGI
jgi:ABC-2 type transport system permease protein